MSWKQVGDQVTLYYRLQYGDPPKSNDVLRTRSGRCYLVRVVTQLRTRLRVHCVIVPADVVTPGRWYTLEWDKRRRARA